MICPVCQREFLSTDYCVTQYEVYQDDEPFGITDVITCPFCESQIWDYLDPMSDKVNKLFYNEELFKEKLFDPRNPDRTSNNHNKHISDWFYSVWYFDEVHKPNNSQIVDIGNKSFYYMPITKWFSVYFKMVQAIHSINKSERKGELDERLDIH